MFCIPPCFLSPTATENLVSDKKTGVYTQPKPLRMLANPDLSHQYACRIHTQQKDVGSNAWLIPTAATMLDPYTQGSCESCMPCQV